MSSWQDHVIDHAIEKANDLQTQLHIPVSSWKDKIAGLERAGHLVFNDESLPEEFREELAGLLYLIDAYARGNGPATPKDDLYHLVEYTQRVARVIRESEGRLLS